MRSQPGAGSTFTVLLPVEADAYASYAESKKGPPPLPGSGPIPLLPPAVIPPRPSLAPPPAVPSGLK